jgi:adenylate cyclase
VDGTDLRQRLTAILAADAAGYSRLMAIDDRATVAALDAARAVFRAQIESNRGHVIDMAGDSVLAVFETAAGAVSAAVAVQLRAGHVLRRRAAGSAMRFRIGVHMGDVDREGGRHGVRRRREHRMRACKALAEPGGVIVSRRSATGREGRVSAEFVDQGEQQVKNIAHSGARLSSVRGPSLTPAAHRRSSAPRAAPAGQALARGAAVHQHERRPRAGVFFADGITEDIITDCSKISGLFVIARNSSFTFKNKRRHQGRRKEAGRAARARRQRAKAGMRVRINVQSHRCRIRRPRVGRPL